MLQTFWYLDDRYRPMNRKLMPSGLRFDPLPIFQIHIERLEKPLAKLTCLQITRTMEMGLLYLAMLLVRVSVTYESLWGITNSQPSSVQYPSYVVDIYPALPALGQQRTRRYLKDLKNIEPVVYTSPFSNSCRQLRSWLRWDYTETVAFNVEYYLTFVIRE